MRDVRRSDSSRRLRRATDAAGAARRRRLHRRRPAPPTPPTPPTPPSPPAAAVRHRPRPRRRATGAARSAGAARAHPRLRHRRHLRHRLRRPHRRHRRPAVSSASSSGEWHMQWSDDAHSFDVRLRGTVTFTDDLTDVQTLSDGGSLTLRDWSTVVPHTVEITSSNGTLTRTYFVAGLKRPWDDEAKRFLCDAAADPGAADGHRRRIAREVDLRAERRQRRARGDRSARRRLRAPPVSRRADRRRRLRLDIRAAAAAARRADDEVRLRPPAGARARRVAASRSIAKAPPPTCRRWRR